MKETYEMTVNEAYTWLCSLVCYFEDDVPQEESFKRVLWDWESFPQFDWTEKRELLELFESRPDFAEIWGDGTTREFEPDVTVMLKPERGLENEI